MFPAEYNIFLDKFSPEKRIRLQDLTRRDVELYVRDKLQRRGNPDLETIILKITDKADGVFLWVALVVKSVQEHLDTGYEPSEIEEELDSLPQEMEGLFTYLLQSLETSARKRAYRLFSMMLIAGAYGITLSVLACSFLDNFIRNPLFAMDQTFPYHNLQHEVKVHRTRLGQRKINADCRSFLEAKEMKPEHRKTWNGRRYSLGTQPNLLFTHRSIIEFLKTLFMQVALKSQVGDFDAVEALSQVTLTEIQSTAP